MTPDTITIPVVCLPIAGFVVILLIGAAAWWERKQERLRCHLLAKDAKRTLDHGYPEDRLDILIEQIASGKPDLAAAVETELCRLPGQA